MKRTGIGVHFVRDEWYFTGLSQLTLSENRSRELSTKTFWCQLDHLTIRNKIEQKCWSLKSEIHVNQCRWTAPENSGQHFCKTNRPNFIQSQHEQTAPTSVSKQLTRSQIKWTDDKCVARQEHNDKLAWTPRTVAPLFASVFCRVPTKCARS